MLTKEELPDCPVATTVQLIGNKRKILILRNLLARPWRFNEMLRSIPGIIRKGPSAVDNVFKDSDLEIYQSLLS